MEVDMDDIWKTIFSREAIGIMVVIVGVFIVLRFLKRVHKGLLAVIVLGALVAVGYVYFPELLDAVVTWFKGGWMDN